MRNASILNFFKPPFFEDADLTRKARLFHVFLVYAAALAALILAMQAIVLPQNWIRWLLFFLLFTVMAFVLLAINRKGKTIFAASMYLYMMLILVPVFGWTAGGIESIAVKMLPLLVFLAGLLLGWKKVFLFAGLSLLVTFALVLAELKGYLPDNEVPHNPISLWMNSSFIIVFFVLLAFLSLSSLERSLHEAGKELALRSRTEADLRESESKFRLLFETSRDFLYRTAMDGRIIDVNRAAGTISGYSLDELKEMNMTAMYYDPIERGPLVKKILEQGFVENYEIKGRKKDGTIAELLVTSILIRDSGGNPVGFQGTLKDITERKKADEALRESERRYKLLFDSIPESVLLIGTDRCIEAANPASALLYRYETPRQLEGFDTRLLISEKDRVQAARIQGELLQGGEKPARRYTEVRRDGSEFVAEVVSTTLYGPGGEVTGYIGITRDITAFVEAEEKVQKSLHEKETLIRELFHRTKNTMQIIRGMIVLQAAEFPENKELGKVIKMTEDRIQAISLVHQMLYTSRDLSRISIKEYIRELCALVYQSFGIATGRISLDLRIEDQDVLLDTAIPFGLILNELLTNSLRHGFPDDRSGAISIRLDSGNSEACVLQYSDTGTGVPAGFDFRARSTLGLKLIFSIGEEQMQGKVGMDGSGGYKCTIEFPKNLYEARV